jgi:hypothetical protein
MTPSLRALALLVLPVLLAPACGGDDAGSATPTDAAALGAADAGAGADSATGSDVAAAGTDVGLPSADAAATGGDGPSGAMPLDQAKVAWVAAYAVFLNSWTPAVIMIGTAADPAHGQVNVPANCPGGGTTLLKGPFMMDAMTRNYTATFQLAFADCGINGVKIAGLWDVPSMGVYGGAGASTTEYIGDLTFSGILSGTCETHVKQAAPGPGMTAWTGTFCGYDIQKLK